MVVLHFKCIFVWVWVCKNVHGTLKYTAQERAKDVSVTCSWRQASVRTCCLPF